MTAKDNLVNVKTAEVDDQRNEAKEIKDVSYDLNEKLDKKLVQDEFHLSCNLCNLKVKNLEDMKQHMTQ